MKQLIVSPKKLTNDTTLGRTIPIYVILEEKIMPVDTVWTKVRTFVHFLKTL